MVKVHKTVNVELGELDIWSSFKYKGMFKFWKCLGPHERGLFFSWQNICNVNNQYLGFYNQLWNHVHMQSHKHLATLEALRLAFCALSTCNITAISL